MFHRGSSKQNFTNYLMHEKIFHMYMETFVVTKTFVRNLLVKQTGDSFWGWEI